MTHVVDDPSTFKEDVIAGFAAAHADHVRRVEGASGFVRAGGPYQDKVGVVIGGGSGHYPSYNGVVGTGFADGAVLGDVFTSPSAEQVYRVARAADGGAGVVLAFGNYAGDRLNFGAAAERLRDEGVDVRVVWVTDDVASAPTDRIGDRRGIAGTFTVYKVAGAAAEEGGDLDEVERVMRAANDATFSFGVAFGGCTLPGADHPLFSVDDGKLELGLGIHGEPGISTDDLVPAERLARSMVERLLEERVDGRDRVALLVNGLGATKYEELYVLHRHVARLLEDDGLTLVAPEVGELVTSLDMAGCSVTLTWLDEELERLWTAPADTPAFRRGETAASIRFTERADTAATEVGTTHEEASAASVRDAGLAREVLRTMHRTCQEHEDELGDLDAVAGDGDHGSGMVRGTSAAVDALDDVPDDAGLGEVLVAAGAAFADRAGGTSGMLWGLLLEAVGSRLGNQEECTATRLDDAVAHACERLDKVSPARPGDKTMVDALWPFRDRLHERVGDGAGCAEAWADAAAEATRAAEATAEMRPRLGRARPLAERSVGTVDPGAHSLALLLTAIGDELDATRDRTVSGSAS